MKIEARVGVFVMRKCTASYAASGAELLLFYNVGDPDARMQIPGGPIASREEPYAAALRQLYRKAGIEFLPLIRPLGVFEADSKLVPNALSRRYCYLFDGAGLPDHWVHDVEKMPLYNDQGLDNHGGLQLAYRWRDIGADFRLRGDLNYFLNADAIPELFEAELQY
jgi:ADP-ribose pyrophosphatase YjhB (NUDIX family)